LCLRGNRYLRGLLGTLQILRGKTCVEFGNGGLPLLRIGPRKRLGTLRIRCLYRRRGGGNLRLRVVANAADQATAERKRAGLCNRAERRNERVYRSTLHESGKRA